MFIAGNSTNIGVVHEELSRLNVSGMRVRQESESSIMVEVDFDNKEWTCSFWNKVQPPVNHNIGSQSASLADRNVTTAAGDSPRPHSCIQVLFSQACLPSSLDHTNSLARLDQLSVPTIALNDDQAPALLNAGWNHSEATFSVTSFENNSTSSSGEDKMIYHQNHLG